MGIWLTELRRNLPPDVILHIVGSKADLVAKTPALREVPFERCIAYVAENLAPDASTSNPLAVESGSGGFGRWGGGMGGGERARSPSSKRSSGFWGQEIGWDCCHEVSAESGEGVDEVFRVVTRKLVEQNRILQEQLLSATQTPGLLTPGEVGGEGGYFDGIMRPGGSFRVGRDRRSWFGVPVETFVDDGDGGQRQGQEQVKVQRKCC